MLSSRLILITVTIILCTCCIYGEELKVEPDFVKAVQHLEKYSPARTAGGVRQASVSRILEDSHNDVIERAEQMLQNGVLATGPTYEVSSTCLNHTEMFLLALVERQQWALRMIDAMGKPPSGLLDFKIIWLGSYDECVKIEATINSSGILTSPYKGRYCKASFKLADGQPSATNPTGGVDLTIGVCVPNSCSSEDTAGLVNTLISLLPFNTSSFPPADPVICQYESLDYTAKAIVVIVILSLFGFVIAAATLYDVIVLQWLPTLRTEELYKYEVLEGTDAALKQNGTGHNYGATGTDPVNGRIEQKGAANGAVSKDKGIEINIEQKQKAISEPQGTMLRILLSFSIYTNATKILSTNQPAGTLSAVNGIRFVSMTWVILGHVYAFGLSSGENLATFIPELMKRFTFQAISNATVSVDTFFTLSGLLVSFLSLKEMKKRGGAGKFKWGLFYFHRFWRLTPPYMLFLMFYVPLIKYWSNGPLWPQKGIEINECESSWWQNLLYINNLVDPNKMCMAWSWYLANDMQFFIVSPLMLIPLFYSTLLGALSCGVLILICFITTGVISANNHLGGLLDGGDSFAEIYVKPWCRIGPYVVGFFTGYVLYKTECKLRIPKVLNLLGWATATAVALLVLYGLYDPSGSPKLSVDVMAFYNATSRTAWAMAVCWVIVACATGHGGWINTLLSWKAVIPLSRLTYCAYLVHPVVIIFYFSSRKALVYFTDLEVAYLFCGILCLSYAVGFLLSLAFESPMMGLEKVLLGRAKNS